MGRPESAFYEHVHAYFVATSRWLSSPYSRAPSAEAAMFMAFPNLLFGHRLTARLTIFITLLVVSRFALRVS